MAEIPKFLSKIFGSDAIAQIVDGFRVSPQGRPVTPEELRQPDNVAGLIVNLLSQAADGSERKTFDLDMLKFRSDPLPFRVSDITGAANTNNTPETGQPDLKAQNHAIRQALITLNQAGITFISPSSNGSTETLYEVGKPNLLRQVASGEIKLEDLLK